ncbi:enoyl-CoA hydratase/isomerase family protein [Rhodococcus opacus]|uniref:enoyl-CoA hydratase/isomerase family protein n=1 Tax=Rhodococcus opacus TaxID=37919 RepID=UPI001CED5CE3|nr:enoyl-CoA hydratase/isomerase family protein [Rhodococcus opacus]
MALPHLRWIGTAAGQSPPMFEGTVPDLATIPDAERHVCTGIQGSVGSIQLNRPRALNALTAEMVADIDGALHAWASEPLTAVVISSTNPKAFCAGGDIRAVQENTVAGDHAASARFFSTEYALNLSLARYQTPLVALIDGICMGGGLGVSVHGAFRIVTENASLAMPETTIGFFPDIGASYFLSRLPGGLGAYLGLTGYRLDAADALYTGLATHFIPSTDIDSVPAHLAATPRVPIDECLRRMAPRTLSADSYLAAHRTSIDRCFLAPTIDEIRRRLCTESSTWATETLELLASKSPQSLEVTSALLARGRQHDLGQCLDAELDVALQMTRTADFVEGVRAALVDKDRAPRWSRSQFTGFDACGKSQWVEVN